MADFCVGKNRFATAPQITPDLEMGYRCQRDLSSHRGSALTAQPILYRDIITWADEQGVYDRDSRLYLVQVVRIADAALLDYLRKITSKD